MAPSSGQKEEVSIPNFEMKVTNNNTLKTQSRISPES
jgi:hypothetical protein